MHQALGLAPLKSQLDAIGGWPLVDSGAWKDEEFMWYGQWTYYGSPDYYWEVE